MKIKILIILLAIGFGILAGSLALAVSPTINLPNPLGAPDLSLPTLANRVIKGFMGITGAIAFALFIYGGILWLTSAGEADKIKKGKDVFLWATIGLAIIFSSYILVKFVIEGLTKSAQLEQEADVQQCHAIAESIEEECSKECKTKQSVDEQCELKCSEEFQTNTLDCKENTK